MDSGAPRYDDHDGEDTLDSEESGPWALDRPRPAVYAVGLPQENIDPDATKVIRRLRRYGHTAYLVGGGVRDLLLGRRPKDFDVATSAKPQEVRRLFRNCRVIGRRFRLAHILFAEGKIIEVATFRRDPMQAFDEVEGEIAEEMELTQVEEGAVPTRLVPRAADHHDDADLLIRNDNIFGEPHEDAIRRDFTINGLFYDLERGEVIDYVGGVPDLTRRTVRTIGSPDVRFREDPVRILRAIKFSARLDLGIDPAVYDAMVEHRGELAKAARPRLLEEIYRLLRGGAAHRSVYLMWDTGVLGVLLPEVASYLDDAPPDADLFWRRLDAIDRRHAEGQLPNDTILLITLLSGPIGEAIEDARDVSREFEDFIDEPAVRLSIPRRAKDRMRSVLTAQRRLATGKLGALPRRDYFGDAATIYAIECEARGQEVPSWAREPRSVGPEGTRGRGRGRRRRRRG